MFIECSENCKFQQDGYCSKDNTDALSNNFEFNKVCPFWRCIGFSESHVNSSQLKVSACLSETQ